MLVISHTASAPALLRYLAGTYPAKIKMSKIIPISKADDETETNNYRPISLPPNFDGIFEKLMYKTMKVFIGEEDILIALNTDFMKNTQPIAIIDIVTCNTIQSNNFMDKRLFLCGGFINLKTAFDTVDHAILLYLINLIIVIFAE